MENEEVKQSRVNVGSEKLFKDLMDAVVRAEESSRSHIDAISKESGSGKSLRRLVHDALQSLHDFMVAWSRFEHVSRTQFDALTRTVAIRSDSVIEVLLYRGIVTKSEIQEAADELLEEVRRQNEGVTDRIKEASLEESLGEAQEEASRRAGSDVDCT